MSTHVTLTNSSGLNFNEIHKQYDENYKEATESEEESYEVKKVALYIRDKQLANLYNRTNKYFLQTNFNEYKVVKLTSGINDSYQANGIDPSDYGRSTPASKAVKSFAIGTFALIGSAGGPFGAVLAALAGASVANGLMNSDGMQDKAFYNVKKESDDILKQFFTGNGVIIHTQYVLEVPCTLSEPIGITIKVAAVPDPDVPR